MRILDHIKTAALVEIEKTAKEQVRFLQKLVRTDSANPYMKDPAKSDPRQPVETEVAGLIYGKLKAFGLSPKFAGVSSRRPNVVCEIGKGAQTFIFNGHMDTVPPVAGRSRAKRQAEIRSGKLYGRGALDMKSALSCFVYVARAFAEFTKELPGKICFQFVVDEEPIAASPYGTSYLLKSGYGGDAAIIGEPGSEKITIGNKGGYRFRLETFGEAVHTGSREWERKQKGANAIVAMQKAITALRKLALPEKPHPAFPGRKNVVTFPTIINGGLAINVVPDSCTALGDIRTLPGVTETLIEKEIAKKLAPLGVQYRLTPIVYVPAAHTDPDEALVQILRHNVKDVLRKEPRIEGSGPWSDLWMFRERNIPAVNYGCDGSGAHEENEYVDIRSVTEATKIYALTALDFLAGENA